MSKKILRTALTGGLICVLAAFCVSASEVIGIWTFEELAKIGRDADYPLGGHYVLSADIDASASRDMEWSDSFTHDGQGWQPIGVSIVAQSTMPTPMPVVWPDPETVLFSKAFTGVFDGNGRKITGLYVNREYPMNVTDMAFPLMSSGLFGALDGATVKNLYIEADTVRLHTFMHNQTVGIGALAGFSRNSVITNCHVTGIIGTNSPGPQFYGNAPAPDVNSGGLVGKSIEDSIVNCSSVVGIYAYDVLSVDQTLPDKSKLGGLVGTSERSVISGCNARVEVTGFGESVGGLVGNNKGGTIIKSGASLALPGGWMFVNAGGLVGVNRVAFGSSCPDCLDLRTFRSTITQSYSKVNINWRGGWGRDIKIGGLVGLDDGGNGNGRITDSYSFGTIKSEIINPDIEGKVIIGGLVGYYIGMPSFTSIERSYTALVMDGRASKRGGLVGDIDYLGAIPPPAIFFSTCYWDTEISGVSTSAGGTTGESTAVMMTESTFTRLGYNWDFTNIWRIDEGESYPYFVWQTAHPVSVSKSQISRAANKNKSLPTITVRGRTLSVKLPPSLQSSSQNSQVRVIDMRGRTIYSRVINNNVNTLSLTKIPAGRYIVEVKNSGVHMGSTPIVIR